VDLWAVSDVEAAKARMPATAVRSGGFGGSLRKVGAIAIYDTPGDLAKALDANSPARRPGNRPRGLSVHHPTPRSTAT
jgi:hypothetical protein